MSAKSRVAPTALAVATLLFATLTLVMRARPISNLLGLVLTLVSPYTPLVALAGLGLSMLSRRTFLTIIAILVLTVTTTLEIPRYYFERSASQFTNIRVLSSNLRKGQADPTSFVALANDSADVVTVSELTREEVERLSRAGIGDRFPFSVLIPGRDATGIGLWSRFPLDTVSPGPHRHFSIAAARLKIPGIHLNPLVMSLHVFSPVSYERDSVDRWDNSITDAKTVLDDFANAAGPAAVIIAGDFNSTPDMRQFRELLTNGYRDAADQTGAGFVPTFPADSWLPPALEIDHVLTRSATATSLAAVTIAGSDHRALLATVHIQRAQQPANGD